MRVPNKIQYYSLSDSSGWWNSLIVLALTYICCMFNPANASIVSNGDFQSGTLNGWGIWGYADVVGGPGAGQAYIVNGIPGGSSDAMTLGGDYPPDSPFAASAGYPSLPLPNGSHTYARDPSIIWQTVSVTAGDMLSFTYTIQGEIGCPHGIDLDWALVSIGSGTLFPLCGLETSIIGPELDLPLREATSDPDFPPTHHYGPDYWLFSYIFPTSGDFTLAFAVVDAADGDPTVNSGMLVDNIRVRHLPEPNTLALLFSAMAIMVLPNLFRKPCRIQS